MYYFIARSIGRFLGKIDPVQIYAVDLQLAGRRSLLESTATSREQL